MDNEEASFDANDVISAYRFSTNHRPELKSDSKCGCFYCERIFHPNEITECIDDKRGTALCPYCGIDTVIGESSGYPISKKIPKEMREYWFKK